MQFKVVGDSRVPATPEPVVELMVRVNGNRAYLCARKPSHTAWTYLLELGNLDGARLFNCTTGTGLPVVCSDGALKVSAVRAHAGGLPT